MLQIFVFADDLVGPGVFFQRLGRPFKSGLFDRLEEQGIEDGDTVSMYDLMFEYKD